MGKLRIGLAGLIGLVLAACQAAPGPESGVAYLVRHAEKVTGEAVM